MSYKKEVSLNDNEAAAKINLETGEVTEIKSKPNNIPEGKKINEANKTFYKGYIEADKILLSLLTPMEYRVVSIMKVNSKMNTNSLDPLNDESTSIQIAELFGIHRNHVKKIFSKLSNLGVYASFEVTNQYGQRIKSWILNPCISFKGRIISKEIIHLFSDTMLSKMLNSL